MVHAVNSASRKFRNLFGCGLSENKSDYKSIRTRYHQTSLPTSSLSIALISPECAHLHPSPPFDLQPPSAPQGAVGDGGEGESGGSDIGWPRTEVGPRRGLSPPFRRGTDGHFFASCEAERSERPDQGRRMWSSAGDFDVAARHSATPHHSTRSLPSLLISI